MIKGHFQDAVNTFRDSLSVIQSALGSTMKQTDVERQQLARQEGLRKASRLLSQAPAVTALGVPFEKVVVEDNDTRSLLQASTTAAY